MDITKGEVDLNTIRICGDSLSCRVSTVPFSDELFTDPPQVIDSSPIEGPPITFVAPFLTLPFSYIFFFLSSPFSLLRQPSVNRK